MDDKKVCGIVMPISAIEGCGESHWSEVQSILMDAIEDAGFEGNLVSNADDVGIIHKRIIQNLYDNPIVVCDVSCKNPNVMFELGLRLAFDKPTIIVKDDETAYSFDTSAIEHLEYPRDLRFSQIVEFKEKLSEKISATYQMSVKDENYTTFLKHFGQFKVAKIDQTEVSGQEFILEELKFLRRSLNRLERNAPMRSSRKRFDADLDYCMGGDDKDKVTEKMGYLVEHPALRNVGIYERGPDHYHLTADIKPEYPEESIKGEIDHMLKKDPRRSRARIVNDKDG